MLDSGLLPKRQPWVQPQSNSHIPIESVSKSRRNSANQQNLNEFRISINGRSSIEFHQSTMNLLSAKEPLVNWVFDFEWNSGAGPSGGSTADWLCASLWFEAELQFLLFLRLNSGQLPNTHIHNPLEMRLKFGKSIERQLANPIPAFAQPSPTLNVQKRPFNPLGIFR